MGSLTNAQLKVIAAFDRDIYTALSADLQAGEAIDALSADAALDLTRVVTELSVTGTDAYTLAAPTFVNQRKIVRCVLASTSPIATLTVSSPDTTTGYVCPSTFVFTTLGQEIELVATSALLWRCVRKKRAGVLAVTVGTTVLTGYSMALVYNLAVTATVSSTGTKGLPNGAVVGERCTLTCGTAASTPIGNIAGTYSGMLGTAYTDIGAIGVVASTTVVGDCAVLEWDGQAWQVIYQNGCTLS